MDVFNQTISQSQSASCLPAEQFHMCKTARRCFLWRLLRGDVSTKQKKTEDEEEEQAKDAGLWE